MTSWEIKQQNQVLVCILHVDSTCMAWSMGFRNLIVPGQVAGLAGMPYDHARNYGAKAALDGGYPYLFFLDSDVIPPRDAILRLMSHNLPIVSGLYCRRSPPHGIPVMIRRDKEGRSAWVTDFVPGSLVEVDMVGAGCLLIRRDLLEKMPPQRPGKHWFDWRVDLAGIPGFDNCLSEDFSFCVAAKASLGVSTFVDTSIVCRHVGLAQATYGSFVPCEATPHT